MPFKAAIYIILVIYQLLETTSREGLAVDRMHLELNKRFSFKHLYLNNALERSDLYHYRNLSVV